MRGRVAAGIGLLAWLAGAGAQQAPLPSAGSAPGGALMAPKAAENRLLDIAVAGARLVAVGQHGVILTSDDGKVWEQSPSPASTMLTRVRFTEAQQGWALGYDATVLHTADGGRTWTQRHHDPEARALYDLLFIDVQRGFAVGAYGTLLETVDGGLTWTSRTNVLSELGMHLNALVSLGDGSLFVVGERGLMARSRDAGATWALLDSPYAGSLFGALPQGETGVLVYGMRGNVFVATDINAAPTVDPATWDPYTRETATSPGQLEALGWHKIDSPVAESLFGHVSLGADTALLLGVNGTALRLDTANGALTAAQTPAAETIARGVRFRDRVIAVGRRGVTDLGAAP